MNQSIFDSPPWPWWMNPKYPMGRKDYFWATTGVGILAFLAWLITVFSVAYIGAMATGGGNLNLDRIPNWLGVVTLIPFVLCLVPLQYRRCKAAGIHYSIVWCVLGLSIVDGLAFSDDGYTFMTLIATLAGLFIWLAPNKMDVVRTKPDTSPRQQ